VSKLQWWSYLRVFGELKILTKASYLFLVLIPILAGIWPAIRMGINNYNQAITQSKQALDFASNRLETAAKSFEDKHGEAVTEILYDLNEKIEFIVSNYSLPIIKKTGLPLVWVLSYFAALFVTVGHLIYQAAAPIEVKNWAQGDYVEKEANYFVNAPSSERLSRAKENVKKDFENSVTLTKFETPEEKMLREFIGIGQPPESLDLKNIVENPAASQKLLKL